MKKPIRIGIFAVALVATFAIGYIVGSIRGAKLESLYGRILRMNMAYGVADAIKSGHSDIVYPDSHSIATSLYYYTTNDAWFHEKLVIPVVEWNEGDAVPIFSFGVNNAAQNLTVRVGKFLSETENQSNNVTNPQTNDKSKVSQSNHTRPAFQNRQNGSCQNPVDMLIVWHSLMKAGE